MSGLGSGDNGEFTFLDTISLISFMLGIANLNMNISQTDLQEETKKLDANVDEKVQTALSEIHAHLKKQDNKLDALLNMIGGFVNDKN